MERRPSRRAVLAVVMLLGGCFGESEPEEHADFVILFPAQSAELDSAAVGILDRAVRAAKAAPRSRVVVAGYSDRSVSPQANQILSRLRAQSVADALVQHGVERSRVHLEPRYAIGGDPGVESRRVEVRVGSP